MQRRHPPCIYCLCKYIKPPYTAYRRIRLSVLGSRIFGSGPRTTFCGRIHPACSGIFRKRCGLPSAGTSGVSISRSRPWEGRRPRCPLSVMSKPLLSRSRKIVKCITVQIRHHPIYNRRYCSSSAKQDGKSSEFLLTAEAGMFMRHFGQALYGGCNCSDGRLLYEYYRFSRKI